MDAWTLKRHNSFWKKNKGKYSSTPLTFKLQQEAWKLNDICVSWSSPKSDLKANFLNLENVRFEYVTRSQ